MEEKGNKLIKEKCNLNIECGENTQKNSKLQHKVILEIFIKLKFIQLSDKKDKQAVKEVFTSKKKMTNLEPGCYILEHPLGSQKSPDFLLIRVCDKEKFLPLECKSGNGIISWHDGWPKDDYIYIYIYR